MRALVCHEYGPPDSLKLEERPTPEPGPGQLLIDLDAAGINFPDLLMIQGLYQVKTPLPFVPGMEAAGTVAALGPGTSGFAAGDRVITLPETGAFAEQCVAYAAKTVQCPDALDARQAAGFSITYGTTIHAYRQSANLQPGETVLVLGAAGGVGITAVELAKAMGARVIAAASSEEKLTFARSAGADETINYGTGSLREQVKALTGKRGVDVVYDPVGGELALEALRSLDWHGRYLVIGFASGDVPKLPANLALLKEASIIGVWWGTWVEKNPQAARQNIVELMTLVANGALRPQVTESYSLDQFADAFACLSERRARGKVVLTMAGPANR